MASDHDKAVAMLRQTLAWAEATASLLQAAPRPSRYAYEGAGETSKAMFDAQEGAAVALLARLSA